jgi:hypothetical protein
LDEWELEKKKIKEEEEKLKRMEEMLAKKKYL